MSACACVCARAIRMQLWGLGTHLGWAEEQDVEKSLMHDVKDHAPKAAGSGGSADDLSKMMEKDNKVRGFQTNAALPFHTDGSDMFALMCVSQGRAGGNTPLVSAVEVFNRIAKSRPDLAEVLQRPFYFDARGQRSDGAQCQV